jgi:DNA-binding NarL/FixJ family response regulator
MTSPPLIVALEPALAEAATAEAANAGLVILSSWQLPSVPWDLAGARLVCAGTVVSEAEAAACTLAAARGAGVVVIAPRGMSVTAALVEDLRRIGHVEVKEPAAPGRLDRLDADERRLLELLADGSTVFDAARVAHISPRTAHRRLARARAVLAVRTTAEAVRQLADSSASAE